ncbi:hypothetical protein [Bradyrhizobium sp. 191]|uniref:hypothetical protein n=1 Tax=Bradyrhizobium sp. 191 TaxID=2782659 RepID=UPI001FFFAD66|nr:hypothetical protein [Bradyrhizobium sp. 191]UPJ65235.1 hypothetical protein IVB23_35820 [Bradyrhizobium sp. 191]
MTRAISFPGRREPREVVVDHGDGTVSSLMDAKFLEVIDGIVRGRRAGDVFRKRAEAA